MSLFIETVVDAHISHASSPNGIERLLNGCISLYRNRGIVDLASIHHSFAIDSAISYFCRPLGAASGVERLRVLL